MRDIDSDPVEALIQAGMIDAAVEITAGGQELNTVAQGLILDSRAVLNDYIVQSERVGVSLLNGDIVRRDVYLAAARAIGQATLLGAQGYVSQVQVDAASAASKVKSIWHQPSKP